MNEGIFDNKIQNAMRHLDLLQQFAILHPDRRRSTLYEYEPTLPVPASSQSRQERIVTGTSSSVMPASPALADVLTEQVDKFSKRIGIEYLLDFGEGSLSFGHERDRQIPYLFQETLAFIARHFRAKWVFIVVKKMSGDAIIIICDDGKCFYPSLGVDTYTLELISIRDFTRALGGDISFVGTQDQGCALIFRIPLFHPNFNGEEAMMPA